MPGPKKGSPGAERISETHRGSHEHDKQGGFATNPELAHEAGKRGGDVVRAKYGREFYTEIGRRGGETVKKNLGLKHYAEIGKRGGESRAKNLAIAREATLKQDN